MTMWAWVLTMPAISDESMQYWKEAVGDAGIG
jgi:hypothetical protein